MDQADMVRNILPSGVECIFVRQPEQLGLGHAVLCAERAVGDHPFAVLLADDFLTYDGVGVTSDLSRLVRSGQRISAVIQFLGCFVEAGHGRKIPCNGNRRAEGCVEGFSAGRGSSGS
jgi:UTP--glucose-1-phosphate uridylyltransferase